MTKWSLQVRVTAFWGSFGWGDTQGLPKILGQDLMVISGFMFSGGKWSVSASFLKDLAGSESPSGNLTPMGAVKTNHDLEKMQVKCHFSPSVQSPNGCWFLFHYVQSHFLNETISSDLTHHSGKSSNVGFFILARGIIPSTADRNSLTTWTGKLSEIPKIPSTSVRRTLHLSSCPMKNTNICNGGNKRRRIRPVGWNLLGRSQSANSEENCSRTGNGVMFNPFIPTLRGLLQCSLYLPLEGLAYIFIIKHSPHADF